MNSLGFDKPPARTRVVVAMSGGVDSSVVATLLHEQGFDVIGVTLQLYDHGEALKKKGACCAGQDIRDAARVARACGFPHYVIDYESNFRNSVIEDFANSYLRGETPVPCIRCNQSVKFRDLLAVARDLGADCLATGHYARREESHANGPARMLRATDPRKDQSYFLFATTQEQLEFLRFPLGNRSKEETRREAQRLGLVTANKPDSQDICFVPGGDYASVIKSLRPDSCKPGEIVHLDGRVIGAHQGIVGYTIGQRKGLGIGGGFTENNDPLYVIRLDPQMNRVIVGPKEALACDTLHLKECNWITKNGLEYTEIKLKFRSSMTPVAARVTRQDEKEATLTLRSPEYGVSPGQAAVCYIGDEVLGGGWIAQTESATQKGFQDAQARPSRGALVSGARK